MWIESKRYMLEDCFPAEYADFLIDAITSFGRMLCEYHDVETVEELPSFTCKGHPPMPGLVTSLQGNIRLAVSAERKSLEAVLPLLTHELVEPDSTEDQIRDRITIAEAMLGRRIDDWPVDWLEEDYLIQTGVKPCYANMVGYTIQLRMQAASTDMHHVMITLERNDNNSELEESLGGTDITIYTSSHLMNANVCSESLNVLEPLVERYDPKCFRHTHQYSAGCDKRNT